MDEDELLVDCLSRLNRLGLDYYLTGSMASNFWGIPRTTHDLDFVLRLKNSDVPALVRAFSGDFYIDESSVRAAFRPPWQFNAIDTRSALKVDFWLPKAESFDQEMFRRRLRENLFDVPAWIASPEDVIVHKLLWNKISPSQRQLTDAAGVWSLQKASLDLDYMKKWAEILEVNQEIDAIISGQIAPKTT